MAAKPPMSNGRCLAKDAFTGAAWQLNKLMESPAKLMERLNKLMESLNKLMESLNKLMERLNQIDSERAKQAGKLCETGAGRPQ
jgi:ABC-type transporter Mla subunit MlaD